MSNQNAIKQYRPSKDDPALLELVTDVASFSRKWKAPKLAKTLGITKQSLDEHIKKSKEKGGEK